MKGWKTNTKEFGRRIEEIIYIYIYIYKYIYIYIKSMISKHVWLIKFSNESELISFPNRSMVTLISI